MGGMYVYVNIMTNMAQDRPRTGPGLLESTQELEWGARERPHPTISGPELSIQKRPAAAAQWDSRLFAFVFNKVKKIMKGRKEGKFLIQEMSTAATLVCRELS